MLFKKNVSIGQIPSVLLFTHIELIFSTVAQYKSSESDSFDGKFICLKFWIQPQLIANQIKVWDYLEKPMELHRLGCNSVCLLNVSELPNGNALDEIRLVQPSFLSINIRFHELSIVVLFDRVHTEDTQDPGSLLLVFEGIRKKDKGDYICRAKYSTSILDQKFTLNPISE